MKLLGIGSRVNHQEFGKGVVTNVTSKHYWITFMDSGMETLPLDEPLEIIEACEDEVDVVSFFEVESILKKVLRKWNGFSEPVLLLIDGKVVI